MWNESTNTTTTHCWSRSWRQEIRTDLGSDFLFIAQMETVAVTDGAASHKPLQPVIRRLSQVATDPDVVALQALLTTLTKKWWDEDQANATVPSDPF